MPLLSCSILAMTRDRCSMSFRSAISTPFRIFDLSTRNGRRGFTWRASFASPLFTRRYSTISWRETGA